MYLTTLAAAAFLTLAIAMPTNHEQPAKRAPRCGHYVDQYFNNDQNRDSHVHDVVGDKADKYVFLLDNVRYNKLVLDASISRLFSL
jgi:hypothetical protein